MKTRFLMTLALIIGLATYANNIWAVSTDSLSRAGLAANADLFPFINLTFAIPSDGTLLTQNNFAVTEDGKPKTLREFISPESSGGEIRAVDIVFVHDDSRSLDDEAAQVKANIQSFLAALSASNLDYRIGLVPYGGSGRYSSSPPEGLITNNGNLYRESASLIAEIDKMRFSGSTERAYAAMQLAVRNINWRPSTQKVLILITDEDNNGSSVPTESELITELQTAGAMVYALTNPSNDYDEFDKIVAQTGGKLFNVTADFNVILGEIGTTLSAQYHLQYETDNLSLDEQPRTVKVTVTASDDQGTALQETFTAYYTPTPPIKITLTPNTQALTHTAQSNQSPIRIVGEIARQGVSSSITAYCFYKQQQALEFSRVAMSPIGSNLYEAFIPAEAVSAPFVNFYLQAEDAKGKVTLPSVDPDVQPFVIPVLPNESPLITHSPITVLQIGQNIVISATVTDTTNQVNKVTLYYRKVGQLVYQTNTQTFEQPNVQFTATIPGEVVTSNGIQYYLSAEDEVGTFSTFGTPDQPYTAIMSEEFILGPDNVESLAGTTHTVSVTAVNKAGNPVPNQNMIFNVFEGPSVGSTGTAVTDANGQAVFSYTVGECAGTDKIQARFVESGGNVVTFSNPVSRTTVPTAPIARFTVPESGFVHQAVNLDASSSTAYCGGGSLTSYQWQSDDGQTIPPGATSSVTYVQAGTYTLTLTVTDNLGAVHSTSQTITISVPPPPIARAVVTPLSGEASLTVALDGSSSTAYSGGNLTKYEWQSSDGQPIPAGATSSITYSQPGQYQITLTITDNLGGTHSTQQTIRVILSNQDALTVFLTGLGAESVNLENRLLSFVIAGETHSGLLAEQITQGTSPGDNLLANPIGDANNDGLEDVLIAYPSGDQQLFYYFGTGTDSALGALRRYFESFGAEAIVINADGVFFTFEGKTYQGELAAEIRPGTPSNGFLILTPINDPNGDGINDYEITYPNGTQQTLYSFFKEIEDVVAEPLSNTEISTPETIADFLYNADDPNKTPIQTDVEPGTIDPDKLAVLRGKVTNRDKQPLTEVTITLQNHPEFGQTRTQNDGTFSLVVNGGESFTLKYTKPGYLSAQRQLDTQPKGFFWAEDVVMIPREWPQGQDIDLSNANTQPMQIAQGPEVASTIELYPDINRPSRQATMFFPQGTLATLSDGTRLETFEVQITEYTIDDNDLAAMPTPLPPNTGYTYAVNISANRRTDVQFNRMIPFYLTNFLGFPVGSTVPVGRLDENSDSGWVPSADGRVIKVLNTDNGIANIDTNGDGLPDDELGITPAEKQEIAKQFQAESEFLRIEVNQLGNYDLNWPLRTPPKPAVKPGTLTPTANEVAENPTLCSGCTIDAESQVLKKAIPMTGVPFNLNYRSNRTHGRTANYQVNIPLQDAEVQTPKRILLEVSIAGQKISQVFSDNPLDKPVGPLDTQNYTYEWDGKDAYGRPLQGKGRHEATVRIGYVYEGIYEVPPEVSQALIDSGVVQCTETGTTAPNDERGSFGCINVTDGISLGIPARQEVTGWQEYTINLGAWIPRAFGLGGWTLDIHHTYDPNDEVLHRGDGRQRQVAPLKREDNILIASEDGGVVYEFNKTGTHLRTLDSLTGKTIYEFAYSNGYLIEITDIDGNLTRIERDANDNPLAIIAPSGQRTELSLDTNGYLASVRNPLNEVHQMLYTEKDGLLTEYTDPRGNVTTYQHNDNGLFVENTDPAEGGWKLEQNPENNGYTVTLTSEEGRESRAEITKLEDGTLKQVNTAPDGTQTTITQQTEDNQKVTLSIERADGTEISLQQRPEQRFQMQSTLPERLTIKTPNGLVSTTTTERIPELADENDPLSLTKLTETVTINGRTSTSVYEVVNKKITTTSAEDRQTVSHLDDNGRVIKEQNPGLEDVHYQYDSQGRLTEIQVGDGAEARTTQISYNNTNSISQITDALGRQVKFSYDKANRVSTIVLADGREIKYGYDENSNLTEITSPGRPTQTFDYTEVNLPKEQQTPESPEQQTRYEYNKDQQLTQIIRPNEKTVDLLYDDVNGRLNTIKFPNGEKSYVYDSKRNISRILLSPDNSTLNYSYDGFLPLSETSGSGNMIGRVTNTYDEYFQVIATRINGSHTVNYHYDADGLLIEAGFLKLYFGPNGLLMVTQLGSLSTQRTHNGFGEIKTETATHNKETLYHVEYRYDKGGRITEKTETLAGEKITYSYKYDQAGRLSEVSEESEDGILTEQYYRYDSNDNRLSADTADGFVEGQYDAQQRLTEYGETTYEYSANGELLRKNQAGAITEYEYDVFSNLRTVKLPDKQIEYLIDGKDRRIAKLVDGELTQGFLYQGSQNPIAELDTSGNVRTRFVYGSKTNVPDYLIKEDKIYRILSDPLGSPRLVVDIHDGTVVQRLDYDVFGKVTQDTQPGFQPFGFAGGLYDADTGLVRFGVREYDAETGRWTTLEPNARVSAYALNNPIEQLAKLSPSPTRFLELQVNIASRLFTPFVRKGISQWETQKREGLERGVRMTQDDLNQLSEDVAKFNGSSRPLPSSSSRLNNWHNAGLTAQMNNVMKAITQWEAEKQERIANGLTWTPEQFSNLRNNLF